MGLSGMINLLVFSLLSLFISPVLSETFHLKDGSVLQGQLVESSESFYIYKDNRGKLGNIPKAEVDSITTNPPETPKKMGGKKPIGLFSLQEDTPLSLTDGVEVELTHELVSDFVWRGNSYGGEYLARRNNSKYSSVSEYYAYQPNLKVSAPSGLYFELWGNLPLTNRADKDSDLRVLQTSPGALGVDPNYYLDRLANSNFYNPENGSSVFYDPAQNLYSNKCDPTTTPPELCNANPLRLKNHKEQNGMWRTDGLFTTFAYNFKAGKFGDFTMGIWWYFEGDKKGRYSWDEYFLWWNLPILRKALNPQIQVYTQGSQDVGANGDGGTYAAFYVSHTFREDKFFRVQPYNNIGYKYPNTNFDQKSGLFDITTGIKFFFGQFFVSVNNAHRDVHMYDNSTFYYPDATINNRYYTNPVDGGLNNRSQYDGKTVDPSKMFGPKNDLFYALLDSSEADQLLKNYVAEKYYLQDIPRNLFWVSFGYQHRL